MTELAIRHLHASLGGARIIHDVSLDLAGPGFIGLVGPNGAGKTTLIRAIASLIPFEGEIALDGVSLAGLSARARANRLAYLAQNAESHWPIEVSRLVALGRMPHLEPFRKMGADDEAAIERAMALADVERYRGRDVMTLSGGERQRVALGRFKQTGDLVPQSCSRARWRWKRRSCWRMSRLHRSIPIISFASWRCCAPTQSSRVAWSSRCFMTFRLHRASAIGLCFFTKAGCMQ